MENYAKGGRKKGESWFWCKSVGEMLDEVTPVNPKDHPLGEKAPERKRLWAASRSPLRRASRFSLMRPSVTPALVGIASVELKYAKTLPLRCLLAKWTILGVCRRHLV